MYYVLSQNVIFNFILIFFTVSSFYIFGKHCLEFTKNPELGFRIKETEEIWQILINAMCDPELNPGYCIYRYTFKIQSNIYTYWIYVYKIYTLEKIYIYMNIHKGHE